MSSVIFTSAVEGVGSPEGWLWTSTTAEILYRLPDHPALLQTYVWQDYDLAPRFPVLMKFLAFWRDRLEGPLHSVRVAHTRLIKPAEIRNLDAEMLLH